jgi:hypothetical protein
MAASQGTFPRVVIKGKMCGLDVNGQFSNNSVDYRGMPYSVENAIDQARIDQQREEVKPSWQQGLRVVAVWTTLGTISAD